MRFGPKTAAEVVREAVLELTYTAHDMAAFAVAIGHVGETGEVLPPFRWDDERRLNVRAKLNALYFHLYGVPDREDIRYVYSTFPSVQRDERAAYGAYRSRDLCLSRGRAPSPPVTPTRRLIRDPIPSTNDCGPRFGPERESLRAAPSVTFHTGTSSNSRHRTRRSEE